ncbi:MAG: serine/threonine protein phosphatase [Bacteroidetes bacterium]|nr:serine/threonine protein phosphatase [Bacteroidota bacterium]
MNFVIGDVHGEYTKLKSLIKNVLSIDGNPNLIFIGDYINKGEDSYSTLKYLTQIDKEIKCVFLLGNHEYYWKLLKESNDQYAQSLIKFGAKNTINSINKELSILETQKILFNEFKSFFEVLKNYHIEGEYIITHSGIPPELYNTPIEKIATDQLLFNRYDFLRSNKLYFNKKIIFGHTGFYSPYYDGFKIGIDTAACYMETQPLTAFCTDEIFFINSNNETSSLSAINQAVCPAIPRVKAWRQL